MNNCDKALAVMNWIIEIVKTYEEINKLLPNYTNPYLDAFIDIKNKYEEELKNE